RLPNALRTSARRAGAMPRRYRPAITSCGKLAASPETRVGLPVRPGHQAARPSSAAVAGIGLGLPVIDRSMPAARPISADVAYPIGAKVTVIPPAGASLDLSRTRPGDEHGNALFLVDSVRVAFQVGPFRGTLAQAAARLRARIVNTTGFQIAGDDRAVWTDLGVAGRLGGYGSPGRLGQYAVFVADGLAVQVTASGPELSLRAVRPRLLASLRSIRFASDR
ncbi:MAG TPA: hypothetical protein VF163_21535, partial [Micromonosporaceae bacterium]